MEINIPRIVRRIALRDYAPEMEDAVVFVWVNIPRRLRTAFADLTQRVLETRREIEASDEVVDGPLAALDEALFAWYAEVWSQGEDKSTHWSAEDARALFDETRDDDPGFWPWLTSETLRMIWAYRSQKKKRAS